MDKEKKIVLQYKAVIRSFLYIMIGVILYATISFTWSELVFAHRSIIPISFINYFFILCPGVLVLSILLLYRFTRLVWLAKRWDVIKWHPLFYVGGFILAGVSVVALPVYVGLFWVVANRVLKRSADATTNTISLPPAGP